MCRQYKSKHCVFMREIKESLIKNRKAFVKIIAYVIYRKI